MTGGATNGAIAGAAVGQAVSARGEIQDATRAVHLRLHAVPAFARLADGTLDRAEYRGLLGRLFGFHAPMEPAIEAALAHAPFAPDPRGWRRAARLRDDLVALGLEGGAIDGLPRLRRLPGMATPAAAMGCLYVLEGSTLGGRQLARRLDGVLGAQAERGRGFLRAGADPGHVSWRAFCAAVEACGADPRWRADMIEGARATFAAFEAWFAAAPAGARAEAWDGPRENRASVAADAASPTGRA